MMASEIHIEPAYYHWHGTVGSHGDEEEGGVLEIGVVVDGDEDAEAGDADADWYDGDCESVL